MRHNQIAHIIRYTITGEDDFSTLRNVSSLFREVVDHYVHDVWERFMEPPEFYQAVDLNHLFFIEKILNDKTLRDRLPYPIGSITIPDDINFITVLMVTKTLEMDQLILQFGKTSPELHLMIAARWGRADIVRHYLSQGVSAITKIDFEEHNPLKLEILNISKNFMLSVDKGIVDECNVMYHEDMRENFITYPIGAVSLAALSGSMDTYKLFESAGSSDDDVGESEDDFYSVFEFAMMSGNHTLARYIISKGNLPYWYCYNGKDNFSDWEYYFGLRLQTIDDINWEEILEYTEYVKEDEEMFIELKKNIDSKSFVNAIATFGNSSYYYLIEDVDEKPELLTSEIEEYRKIVEIDLWDIRPILARQLEKK